MNDRLTGGAGRPVLAPDQLVMQVVQPTGEVVETRFTDEDLKLDWRKSACPYCGVGCGVLAGARDGRVQKVRGDPNHPANLGLLCQKGATLAQMLYTPDRLDRARMRTDRTQETSPVPLDEALTYAAARWKRIVEAHGPDAVAFYISGQLLTEDYFVVNTLAKALLGTNNVDSNSRLCMASAVTGYVSSLGADAPPGCYADIELADCFLLIGSNTHACHPVTFERIRRRKAAAPDRVKVIVVDPRRTRTAEIADVFLPVLPGSDVALLNGMLHVLEAEKMLDAKFISKSTSGWPALKALVKQYPPDRAAALCGVKPEAIVEAARAFGHAKAAMSLWAMGMNQSTRGTAKNNALINLHLATGHIGRPGASPFSLTGQPNAMGGRETGGLAHLLPGHRVVTDAKHRQDAERLWGIPAGRVSPQPGLSAVDLFKALEAGTVKALWVMATNPAASMPNLNRTRAALERAEFVMVSDAYHPTETTKYADVLLPAAQWSERDGTVTNSERTISYLEKIVDPPGDALPDWELVRRFAKAYGAGEGFDWPDASAVYEDWKRFTVGRDLDIGGVTYDRLKESPLQWPCPTPAHGSTLRRYTDGKFSHPDRKARFIAHEYEPPVEPPDAQFPLILTTGRVRDQWHTMTRTGKVPILMRSEPAPFVEVHPDDAEKLGIDPTERVRVVSRRGTAEAAVRVTPAVRPGTCFMPFHWGPLWGGAAVNQATQEAYDPVSKQPELKHCAVRVERAGKA